MSAEYGRSGASLVKFTVKSGTNQVHGSVFELLRNEKLDARNWLAPSRVITRQNEFGASVGGPVYLPKIYNGKDRTFWVASKRSDGYSLKFRFSIMKESALISLNRTAWRAVHSSARPDSRIFGDDFRSRVRFRNSVPPASTSWG